MWASDRRTSLRRGAFRAERAQGAGPRGSAPLAIRRV
jgi:hypothetical protein